MVFEKTLAVLLALENEPVDPSQQALNCRESGQFTSDDSGERIFLLDSLTDDDRGINATTGTFTNGPAAAWLPQSADVNDAIIFAQQHCFTSPLESISLES